VLRHTVCNIEFGATDLERAAAFYRGVLGWTVTAGPPNALLFRSDDGLAGTIRQTESFTRGPLPLLRVEVDEFTPLLELAARHGGGYVGFVDPSQGEWTVNLCDPDGNLIRLSNSAAYARNPGTSGQAVESDAVAARDMAEPVRAATRPVRARQSSTSGGRASAPDYEPGTNGNSGLPNRAGGD